MAGAKEIRTQIRSIQNTQKITKAMEMVAASKMRKAQDRMQAARPYAEKIRRVVGHLAYVNPDERHPFLVQRTQTSRIGMIVVSTDRGLCGGLNVNLFRTAVLALKDWHERGAESEIGVFGSKGGQFFKRMGFHVVAQRAGLGDRPHLTDLIGSIKVMLDAYQDGQIDQLYLASNQFINTMSQRPVVRKLLPIEPSREENMRDHWDYIYEPNLHGLLDDVLIRYVESQIYQAVVENVACEMAARMVAMKSASDNAGQIIDNLKLAYNKARQAAITRELAEITAGAAAVS